VRREPLFCERGFPRFPFPVGRSRLGLFILTPAPPAVSSMNSTPDWWWPSMM